LDSDTPYCKFAAYAVLNHDGDFSAAARELSEQGYNDTEYYCYGEMERKVEESFAEVEVEDAGTDLKRGEVV
jgi:hypothetical protein